LEGFWDLGTKRPVGFGGVGEIPYDEPRRYARRRGLRGDNVRAFELIMRGLEEVYQEWLRGERGGA
jgi:hypothetical protein